MLLDKGIQQGIHGAHDTGVTADLERPVLLNGADTRLLDITRNPHKVYMWAARCGTNIIIGVGIGIAVAFDIDPDSDTDADTDRFGSGCAN